ncbi:MAG: hypothetical protein ABIP77_10530 [Candidatus Limnocylindrales bacterium]
MTTLTDFDRLLSTVLEVDGPQGVPPGLVDAALAQARTVGQRRPFIPVADRLGWPPIGWPVPRAVQRRFTILTLVALLAAALVASALLIAGGRARSLVDAGERIYVWANSRAHLVTADGVTSLQTLNYRNWLCPPLVPGTLIVGQSARGQWNLMDLTTGRAVGSVSTNYGGGERWSPHSAALALFDFTGRVGLVDLADPARPVTHWIPVLGVVDVAWSLDGDRLAVLVIRDGAISVVVIDAATDAVTTVATSLRGDEAQVGWASRGSRVDVRMASVVAGGYAWTSTLVDTQSGTSIKLPDVRIPNGQEISPSFGALSPDGLKFAKPLAASVSVFNPEGDVVRTLPTVGPAQDLAWSPDGRHVAFRDGDALVVADVEDETRATMALDPTEPFAWHRSGEDLIVARQADGGAVVERYRGRDLELLAWKDLPSPAGTALPPDAANPRCLQLDDGLPTP